MRFGAVGATTTVVPEAIPLMRIVLESLKKRIADVTHSSPFRSMAVVFEDNPRAHSFVESYFGDFRVEKSGEKLPIEFYFMPKRAMFPALEVADFGKFHSPRKVDNSFLG